MKTNPNKATPRVYHTLRQIVQRIPRWLIEKTANAHGVDARKFSATSHFVMLILGHLSRASCLTEICDVNYFYHEQVKKSARGNLPFR